MPDHEYTIDHAKKISADKNNAKIVLAKANCITKITPDIICDEAI